MQTEQRPNAVDEGPRADPGIGTRSRAGTAQDLFHDIQKNAQRQRLDRWIVLKVIRNRQPCGIRPAHGACRCKGERSGLAAKSIFQQRGVRSWTRSAGCFPTGCRTSTRQSYGLMSCSRPVTIRLCRCGHAGHRVRSSRTSSCGDPSESRARPARYDSYRSARPGR